MNKVVLTAKTGIDGRKIRVNLEMKQLVRLPTATVIFLYC